MDDLQKKKARLSQLQAELVDITDAKQYDQVEAEIRQLQKEINLAEARLRKATAERLEAEHQAAIEHHREQLAVLAGLKNQLAVLDQAVWEDLEAFYGDMEKHHKLSQHVAELSQELGQAAGKLGLEPVPFEKMTVCHVLVHGETFEDATQMLLDQYAQATGQIKSHKRRGVYAPDQPGMDWFARGDGRYWDKPEMTTEPEQIGQAVLPVEE